jgi:hypothetical protein
MRYVSLVVALILTGIASAATSPSAGGASAATLKRNYVSCSTQANLDACYDAIRWNPGDPALLTATGDALMLAGRPADAIRNYHRAAQLAPATKGIAAKISKAEARLKALTASMNRRYSNNDPETQSH